MHHAANATSASSATTKSTKNATFTSDDTNALSSTVAAPPSFEFDEKYLSNYSKSLICEKLCNEIQVYKKILSVSINLDKEDVDQSIEDLKRIVLWRQRQQQQRQGLVFSLVGIHEFYFKKF